MAIHPNRPTHRRRNAANHWITTAWLSLLGCALLGCGTTNQKIGTEQLLLSDAVDNAINEIDFTSLRGRSVYVDRTYLQSMQTNNVVDANYVVSCLRQQLLAAGCHLQDNKDTADVVVEPRVGTLGGDSHEIIYGIPNSNGIGSAASALANIPVPAIPELSLGRVNANSAVAKVAVFAYDRETRRPIWQSGNSRARSTARSTWLLGVGPIQKGSVYRGVAFAGESLRRQQKPIDDQPTDRVAFNAEYHFPQPQATQRIAQLLDPTSPPSQSAETEPADDQQDRP